MPWLKSIAREVVGLFVDDGSFALAILVWLGVALFGRPRLPLADISLSTGPTLFLGLALILVESTLRFARSRRK